MYQSTFNGTRFYYKPTAWMRLLMGASVALFFFVACLLPDHPDQFLVYEPDTGHWSLIADAEASWIQPYQKKLFEFLRKKELEDMDIALLKRNVVVRGTAEILKLHEDFRAKPYKCTKGYWTQGYGKLVSGPNVPPVTEQQAYDLMLSELNKAATYLDVKYPWWQTMSQTRRQALLNFTYNIGPDKLTRLFPKFLKALEAKQYKRAAYEILHGSKGKSEYWEDVGDRAVHLANTIRSGEWEFEMDKIKISQFDQDLEALV